MPHAAPSPWHVGRRRAVRAPVIVALALACPVAADAAEVPPRVTLERVAGEPLAATLLSLDGRSARIEAEGRQQAVPVHEIRRLVRVPPTDTTDGTVTVTLTDGSRLVGDEFTWTGDGASLTRAGERATLPGERVRMVSWVPVADGGAPAWLALLPEPLDSDVVVVGAGESLECVPCAITKITAETVTVVLDGETIPVRRDKIAGLRWFRDDVPPGGVGVDVDGGRLAATAVAWSADGLVLDDVVRLPAAWLRSIDYAAGRTVSLVDVPPERVEVEPFFAGLAAVEGLSPFFAPRSVAGDARAGTPPGLVIRPRTRAIWRVPPDARRFRAVVLPAAGAGDASLDSGIVAISVDGTVVLREPVMQHVAGAEARSDGRPVIVELSAARRLEIVIDFPGTGGMGGPVLVGTPVFEK